MPAVVLPLKVWVAMLASFALVTTSLSIVRVAHDAVTVMSHLSQSVIHHHDHIGVHDHNAFLNSITHPLSRKPYQVVPDTVLKLICLLEPYTKRSNHKLPIGFI